MSADRLGRDCPQCQANLPALAIRCAECGFELPEARDVRSDPDQPHCGLCDAPMDLMAQQCPACDAIGFPALRPRQGRKCKRAGNPSFLAQPRD